MRLVVAYLATLVVLLLLDAAWLGTVGGPMFKKTLGDILAPDFSIPTAAIFYAVYVVGVLYFSTLPALADGAWTTALVRGALFGFFAYLTYDLTNLATLRNYILGLALTDTAWGTVVTAVSSTVGFWVTQAVVSRFG